MGKFSYFEIVYRISSTYYALQIYYRSLDRMVASALCTSKKRKISNLCINELDKRVLNTQHRKSVVNNLDEDKEDFVNEKINDVPSGSVEVNLRSCILLFVYFIVFSIVFSAFRVSSPICLQNNNI